MVLGETDKRPPGTLEHSAVGMQLRGGSVLTGAPLLLLGGLFTHPALLGAPHGGQCFVWESAFQV